MHEHHDHEHEHHSHEDHPRVLVLVDVQEKLLRVMNKQEQLLRNLTILVEGAIALEMPIIWLEQYPRGLGRTVPELKALLEEKGIEPIDKMSFSGCKTEAMQQALAPYTAEHCHFIVAGIEAHICVYQTVRDLLAEDLAVEVVADAVGSRVEESVEIALNKMMQLGADLTSVEMCLFELLGSAEHPQFKTISKLIK